MHRRGIPARATGHQYHRHAQTRTHTLRSEMMARLGAGNREGWATLVRAETPSGAAELLQAADVATFPFTLALPKTAAFNGRRRKRPTRPHHPRHFHPSQLRSHLWRSHRRLHRSRRLRPTTGNPVSIFRSVAPALAAQANAVANNFSWNAIAQQSIEVYRKCRRAAS